MKGQTWVQWMSSTILVVFVLFLLFFINGISPGWNKPEQGVTTFSQDTVATETVKLMAYNIRWCRESEHCLETVANLVELERPDILFLSAIYFDCDSCSVGNQVTHLADATGMHAFAFGENYSWGLPFYRSRSGNAVLSRFPVRAIETLQLVGGEPFYKSFIYGPPDGNRRVLWAEIEIGSDVFLVGALHNDSYNIENNLLQTQQILRYIGTRYAILGGDFNAPQGSAPMQAIRESGLFAGEFNGPNTYPASNPKLQIDYILAPHGWKLREHRVLQSKASAHLPVVSVFEPH